MINDKIVSIEKSETEEIRITLCEYRQKKYVDIRIFFQPKDASEMKPTKKGITMNISQLYELAQGLSALMKSLPDHQEACQTVEK